MANPTTNFGWVMPTSSSLVTNLPADFNTFGQGVDTSLQYLLGGTTGQVLSKTSGTNMAFTWVTPTDQTPLTTKGDLFTFSTVDARLAVGTNGQTLVADSSTATGLKWATPAAGGTFPVLSTAQPSGDFSTSSTSFVDITNVTITRTPVSATNKIEIKLSFVCPVSTGLQLSLKGFAGATELGQYTYELEYNGGTPDTINAIWYATNVAASSTVFKVQAKVSTGTVTFYGTGTGYANGFSTLEIY